MRNPTATLRDYAATRSKDGKQWEDQWEYLVSVDFKAKKQTVFRALITPERTELLELRNHANHRAKDKKRIAKHERKMQLGEFTNAGTIYFDQNGFLRDGQHRCQAMKNLGKSYWVWVIIGLTEAECAEIDSINPGQTVSHRIGQAGLSNPKDRSAVISYLKKDHLDVSKIDKDAYMRNVAVYFKDDMDALAGILGWSFDRPMFAALTLARRYNPTKVDEFARLYKTNDPKLGAHHSSRNRSNTFTRLLRVEVRAGRI